MWSARAILIALVESTAALALLVTRSARIPTTMVGLVAQPTTNARVTVLLVSAESVTATVIVQVANIAPLCPRNVTVLVAMVISLAPRHTSVQVAIVAVVLAEVAVPMATVPVASIVPLGTVAGAKMVMVGKSASGIRNVTVQSAVGVVAHADAPGGGGDEHTRRGHVMLSEMSVPCLVPLCMLEPQRLAMASPAD